jgi:hypothetical protein
MAIGLATTLDSRIYHLIKHTLTFESGGEKRSYSWRADAMVPDPIFFQLKSGHILLIKFYIEEYPESKWILWSI